MAFYHSPRLVTDGLILSLDPGNIKSYPGTGTSIYDKSLIQSTKSLSGGASYSSNFGGVFVFDGTNDIINLGIGNTFFPLPNFTMELWFSSDGTTPTTGTLPGLLGITYGIRLFVYSTYINYRLDNGSAIPSLNSPSNYNLYNSSWHHVAIQANSTTRYLYVDGELVGTRSDSWSGATRWPTNGAYIGRDNNNSNYYFRGKMGPIRFYNRVLTSNEILQNYNTNRGRFGV